MAGLKRYAIAASAQAPSSCSGRRMSGVAKIQARASVSAKKDPKDRAEGRADDSGEGTVGSLMLR